MPLEARVCHSCHQSFIPSREDQRFCRMACKNAFHNAARKVAYQRGLALEELPIAKVLWEDDDLSKVDEPQLSWSRREIILEAMYKARERLFEHLEQTLGVERRLLLKIEQAFDAEKIRK